MYANGLMSRVPTDLLERLANSIGYERTLLLDQVMRDFGLTEAEIILEIASLEAGSTQQIPSQVEVSEPVQTQQSISPRFINEPSSLRARYDPSESGMQNQAQITQAIMCPACGVPLGIPETRPIVVKCPSCLHEARYDL